VSNPFKVLIVVAVIIAIVAAVGFILVVFVQNGGHASSLGPAASLVEAL
jgi:hypothetical protein